MSIRDTLARARNSSIRHLWGRTATVCLSDLTSGSSLGGRLPALAGRSVLIAVEDALAAALALAELDGVARRLVLATPDLGIEHLPHVMRAAEVDAIVSDESFDRRLDRRIDVDGLERVRGGVRPTPVTGARMTPTTTEWVLLTSGTTGAPKLVLHTLESLTAPIPSGQTTEEPVVWGTFYDIRRYGGLQILLRALFGGGSFVLTSPADTIGEYLERLAAHKVTHLSGTPSHWRRVLMSGAANAIAPSYVRLSGEIADQGILSALRGCYPAAHIGHAFASTEAGVGFEVNDGCEGFPCGVMDSDGDVRMKVVDGSLRIRSTRTAARYLTVEDGPLGDEEGFVDTGDVVERRGDRCYFLGRRNGVINVGGAKVYPEEVETIINRHMAVRMSRVAGRSSPIVGSLVVAEVVLTGEPDPGRPEAELAALRRQILDLCRDTLAPHKVPATIRFVPTLGIATAGKLARAHA